MTKIAITLCAAALAGCAGMQTIDEVRQIASAGHVGCPAGEIKISDNEKYTWTATCKGRTFYCSGAPDMACKEAIKAPA